MNQASNNSNVVSLHPVVIRYSPISHSPVVFMADKPPVNDMVEVVTENNEHRVVDYNFYKHTLQLPQEDMLKAAEEYSAMAGIPMDVLHLRERLPKKNQVAKKAVKKTRQRPTNDAHMVGGGIPQRRASDKKPIAQESNQDYRSNDERKQEEFVQAAQDLHDQHGKDEVAREQPKATADNPEGAVVAKLPVKRAYNRRSPEEKIAKAKNRKDSARRLAEYHKEVQKVAERNDILIEQAALAVNKEQYKEALAKLGVAVSEILAKIV